MHKLRLNNILQKKKNEKCNADSLLESNKGSIKTTGFYKQINYKFNNVKKLSYLMNNRITKY